MSGSSYRIDSYKLNKAILQQGIVAIEQRAEQIVRNKVDQAQQNLYKNFKNHIVTKDLQSAGGTQSIGSGGQLFGLLGFNAGANPIAPLAKLLLKKYRITKSQKIQAQGNIRVDFEIDQPKIEELYEATEGDLEWASGASWLEWYENQNIPGLAFFLKGPQKSPPSRQGEGLQSKKPVRQGSMSYLPYMTALLKQFDEDLRKVRG